MVTITGETAHEVIEGAIDHVMSEGEQVTAWGGTIPDEEGENDSDREMIEVVNGATYELTNPRKRWSEHARHWPGITLTEVFDDLYELNPGVVGYFAGSFGDQDIYDAWLEDTPDGERYPHTYGQRLGRYGMQPTRKGEHEEVDQWQNVVDFLVSDNGEHLTSRKACFSFWDPHVDLDQIRTDNAYVPCNVFFQVRVRNGELNWHTFSRSKDALRGSTENIFEFTLLQEFLLNEIHHAGFEDVEMGTYREHVSNLHIYQDQIDEGYLEHQLWDPYDEFEVTPFENTRYGLSQRVLDIVTTAVDDGVDETITEEIQYIPDPWGSWTAALVAEAERLRGCSSQKYTAFYDCVNEPWKISLAKRATRAWGDNHYKDALPRVFHSEIEHFE